MDSTRLDGANLEGANLKGAYLARANLQSANLRNCNFQDASLFNADLEGADVTGAHHLTPEQICLCRNLKNIHGLASDLLRELEQKKPILLRWRTPRPKAGENKRKD